MSIEEQEEAFVKCFIVSDRQDRYLNFLSKPRTRAKFMRELSHRLAIKSSLATEIPSKYTKPAYIEAQLRLLGAGELAYVISSYDRFDQKWLPLKEILDDIIPQDGEAIVCCLPGQLALYLSEDSAYILYNPLTGRCPKAS